MKKVKCECGHVNPAGTVLCESCGKPLDDQKSPLADMRYDSVQDVRKHITKQS